MDIRIGVTEAPRELDLTVDDDLRDELHDRIDEAVAAGDGVLWLTDTSGREVAVPVAKIAYLELGRATGGRSIGFSG